MNKREVQQRVSKNGKPLPMKDFTWIAKTRVFSSNKDYLVLDFSGVANCTFTTGSDCIFNTGHSCTFKTGSYCIFNAGSYCIFNTGHSCTFKTGSYCTFNTGSYCIFNAGSSCTFQTGEQCVVVRRDMYEVIELVEGQRIKLNDFRIPGFSVITT